MDHPEVVVVGAASSAGSHHAGQERAPAALRAAGLIDRLRGAGIRVNDLGDVVVETFRPDPAHPDTRNLAATRHVAGAVAAAVEPVVRRGALPLVLGGDCTITLGVLAGVLAVDAGAGLLYLDGDADLGTPGHGSGVLDAMGIAHLLGLAETDLSSLFTERPPLPDARLAMLGYDETDPGTFRPEVLAAHPGLVRSSDRELRADPAGCAERARAAVEAGASRVVVHFDVDVVDSGELPLGNFPHYGTGVPLRAAAEALTVLTGTPRLAAIVLTEVNPSYDPDGDSLTRYVEAVAGALAAGLAPPIQ